MHLTGNNKETIVNIRLHKSKKERIQEILREKNETLTDLLTSKIDETIANNITNK